MIEDSLMVKHPELLCLALTNPEKRLEIKEIIREDYKTIVKDEATAEAATREIVGTGIIEKILAEYEDVTDIEFDGDKLAIAGVTHFKIVEDENITEEYVQRLIQKFAAATKKEFSNNSPILDCVLGQIRLNAVHHSNTTGGTTFSMRIVRPRLALNETNFKGFAPFFMLAFIKVSIDLYCNLLVAGRTGTGKTELQKLSLSYTRDEKDKIGAIQDVPELFAKELNPQKMIYEWVTGNGVTYDDLIRAAMRNNFRWIMPSEIRDRAAYSLYQAMMSSHAIITSLHAKGALKIPRRAAQLAKFAPEAANMPIELLIKDFEELTDFGFYIDKETFDNRDYRFLAEVASYDEEEGSKLIFKQYIKDGAFYWETYELPASFKENLARKGITLNFPENSTGSVSLHQNEVVIAL